MSNFFRSNLSAKPAVIKPENPALNAYAATANPNCLVEKFIDFISKSPIGDMTIKSSTTVNWVNASRVITNFSYEVNGVFGVFILFILSASKSNFKGYFFETYFSFSLK